jgi:hypothetical protein
MYCAKYSWTMHMLTLLIDGNVTPSHSFMKSYTRKPLKFLYKMSCLFGVQN